MTSLQPLLRSSLFDFLAQSGGRASDMKTAAAAGFGIVALLFILTISLVFYVFVCFCMKRICEKAGHEPGILIWIPIANFVPQLTAAKLPIWTIVLFFIPIVGFGMYFFLWFKLCEARGKPGWLAVFALFPPFLMLYLAFAD